jgi:hypothetical protein
MKLLVLALLGLGLSSCSKEVSTNSNNLSSRNPVVEAPTDTNSGTLKMNFANHATVNEVEDELSQFSLTEPLLLTLPSTLTTTYSSSTYKPNLTVLVNNQAVCVYTWVGVAYQRSQNCYVELDLKINYRKNEKRPKS